ncbi:MAG: DUF2946 family protein [Pseudomonadota bacterium]
MSRIIPSVVLLSLFLQQGMFLLTSAININTAQANASDDAMLICSGSEYQWISQAAFMESGNIVYLSAPDNGSHSEKHSLDCGFQCLSLQDNFIHQTAKTLAIVNAYEQALLRLLQRPYTSYPYRHSLSRAPPLLA